MTRLAHIITILLLAMAGTAAAGPREIEYAYPDQSVWTTRLNEAGEPDNPLFRLAEVLFARAGIPWHGKGYPAARLFDYLQDGTAPFSMLVDVPALRECCLYSKNPVATAEVRVYRFAATPPIMTREALAGTSVITIRGYSYGGLLKFLAEPGNRVENNVAPHHAAAFAMFEARRADYLIDYAGPATEVLAARPVPGLTYDVLTRQEVFLVLTRSYPDAAAVMAKLEAIADTLDKESILNIGGR
jgi:ABC-type amino acid transport substrate-binding protein